MKRFKDRRKVLSLTFVGIAYALIVLPLIVSNIQKQQNLRSRAQVASTALPPELNSSSEKQSVQPLCTADGNVELGVSYTNTDSSRSIVVSAADSVSGQRVQLGTIAPQETKTASFAFTKSSVTAGTITYTVAFADAPSQTQQQTSSYSSKACSPATTAMAQLSKASAAALATCGNVTTDIVLVIDKSGSMGSNSKLVEAKNAAKNFIDVVSKQQSTTRISLVTFSTTAALDNTFTTDVTTLKSKIDGLSANGSTCHECGVKTANTEIATHGRTGVKKVVLLLTDGEANYIVGGTAQVAAATAEQKALDAVKAGFAQSNSVFFAIGFDIKSATAPTFLTTIASLTGGKYYFPAPTELDSVYQEISQLIGKGLLGGFVFNDQNLNSSYDATEPKLPGWTVTASTSAGVVSTTTDSKGNYTLAGLCDGTYTLSEKPLAGWHQTLPASEAPYSITISNASQFTDKNFGNTDKSRCNDGLDNDNNGFIDTNDSTCHSDGNPKNPSSYVPTKDGERGGGNTCADSKDNNGNGLIDGADPVCHTDGNPSNPGTYDPNLPETTLKTTATCTPSTLTLTDNAKTLSVTIKTANGTPLTGKNVTWSSSNTAVVLSPLSSVTDTTGKASSSALVSLTSPTAFTGTITASYAGDSTNAASTCSIQTSYTPLVPTNTPTPSATILKLHVLLDGIGNRGDNTNPNLFTLSNKNPKHPTIGADVQVTTLSNDVIASGTGTITYDSATGSYIGNLPVQSGFPSGKYQIKVKADTYLRRLITTIQTITTGQVNDITIVPLVAGDVNNDNKLNILDYNLLLDCYSDLAAAANCSASEKQVKSDINDDSLVNQIDYNLFLREISTQPGQ